MAQIKDPFYGKPKQKGSEVELSMEAKVENIELVDVPIQNGIKFVNKVELDKDLKDSFIVKSIIDEVIQNVIEITNQFHKVHIFWEGHKILRNLHLTFDNSTYSQKLGEDFAIFCGLLIIYEL